MSQFLESKWNSSHNKHFINIYKKLWTNERLKDFFERLKENRTKCYCSQSFWVMGTWIIFPFVLFYILFQITTHKKMRKYCDCLLRNCYLGQRNWVTQKLVETAFVLYSNVSLAPSTIPNIWSTFKKYLWINWLKQSDVNRHNYWSQGIFSLVGYSLNL